ncbi:unnamed protein product [Vitrella brassicaformis CCMP3155]|uniref:Uncharacterized protein n=1 Tax=Vitrella brassicaformis (strain CCMP3155) TaxID=1169540 RepID=A0A0G4ERB9_VITBC|nr:unnamed protein product [Vitrella brassicaformis CCMP3155]|eukprot:CEL99832.1 unnamed protein product [Vitrella brassicaformis CCMP3155]
MPDITISAGRVQPSERGHRFSCGCVSSSYGSTALSTRGNAGSKMRDLLEDEDEDCLADNEGHDWMPDDDESKAEEQLEGGDLGCSPEMVDGKYEHALMMHVTLRDSVLERFSDVLKTKYEKKVQALKVKIKITATAANKEEKTLKVAELWNEAINGDKAGKNVTLRDNLLERFGDVLKTKYEKKVQALKVKIKVPGLKEKDNIMATMLGMSGKSQKDEHERRHTVVRRSTDKKECAE